MVTNGRTLFGLGSLEGELLAIVWHEGGAVTVRDVYEELRTRHPDRSYAYTTVMTVLGNLTKKGVLRKNTHQRTFTYQPTEPPERVLASMLAELHKLAPSDKVWKTAIKEA